MAGKRQDQSQPEYAVEWVEPHDLKAHPENYNFHPPEQITDLEASIDRFGVYRPILISSDGYVLGGHGVTEAALRSIPALPCHRMPFAHDTAEARALMVADNELSRKGQPDKYQLTQLLESIRAESDAGLLGVGHDDGSLEALVDELHGAVPPTWFVPVSEDEQGRLDQLEPKWVQCPSCGDTFDARQAEKA